MESRFWVLLLLWGFGSGEPIVKLDIGSLRGTEMKSENGRTFYSFRGIPYAEPPIKELRFKPPVAKHPWSDKVLDATRDGPLCPQIYRYFGVRKFVGQEDNCLVLNVYTRKLSSESLQPVMVYIHGGGLQYGSGSSDLYGPNKLLDNDIVLVTLNYRLGPLGFLSTGDSETAGNYGMLDQLEALKWVNKHITLFGGDVNRITIFGTSAGGGSVTYHVLSPLSKGLFQNAIAISGSALCTWMFQPEPLVWAVKIGIELGCPIYDTEEMVKCLRDAPVQNLTKSGDFAKTISFLPIVLAPNVDNYFLTDAPLNLLEKGSFNRDIPYMTGITKDEASFVYAWLVQERGSRPFSTKEDLKQALKEIVGMTLHNHKAAELLYGEYVKNLNVEDVEAVRKIYTKVNSEGLFDISHYQTAQLMAKAGVQTYAFKYNYQAPFSFDQLFEQEVSGVSHMDDAFMLFNGSIFDYAVFDERSRKMQKIYQSLLINFAAHGNPTPEISDDIPIEWTPVQVDKLRVYRIDDPVSTIVYEPRNDPSYEFWVEKIPKALANSKRKLKENAKDEL